jgi:transcription antitermination factor NusG
VQDKRNLSDLRDGCEERDEWTTFGLSLGKPQMNKPDHLSSVNEVNQTRRWYALRTRSRHEKLVREQLANQGIEPLLPTIKRLSQWKDRKKEIEVPLFSGYCFVRFASEQKLPVLKTIGVVDIVGTSHCPEAIPDEEIAAIKTLMTSVLPYDTHPYLHEGMQVEVVRGPLQGVHGILLRKEKRHRLVLGVRLIQQAAAVEIDVNDVVPA